MAQKAIWVMLKAKPGKEQEVESFLKAGAQMAQDEPKTVTWYGVQLGPGVYGVFDTFEDEAGRDAHVNGEIAKALMAKAPELFSNEIRIETMDILGFSSNRLGVTRTHKGPPTGTTSRVCGSSDNVR